MKKDRQRYMHGIRGEQFGIWNAQRKCWQFGICENTPMLAEARLFQKIGDDARKWRFEVRKLPKDMRHVQPEPALLTELARKDREIKRLKKEHAAAIAALENERDTAITDLEQACISLPSGQECQFCRFYGCCPKDRNMDCEDASNWLWRGSLKGD